MALIYLEVDDEIITAAARIRTADDSRVGLVLPGGSRIGTSRINFRLLAREAERAGSELSIVSPDGATRALAGAAGLVAYASVVDWEAGDAAEPGDETHEREGRLLRSAGRGSGGLSPRSGADGGALRSASGSGLGGTRGPARSLPVLALVIVVVAFLAGAGGWAAVTFLPTATVTVVVQPEALGPVKVTVRTDPAISAPSVAAATIPLVARTFALEATGSFAATGKKVTETKATGTVRWQNCDPTRSYTIKAGTTVKTSAGVAFTLDASVFLPVANLSFGSPPKITCHDREIGVTAVAAGTAGNVKAGAITKIPSTYNPVVLRVTNPAATSGGTRTETKVASAADVDAAKKSLEAALDGKLTSAVGAIGGGEGLDVLVASATRSEATFSPTTASLVGSTGASFTLTATADGSVQTADRAGVRAIAEARLRATIPSGARLLDGTLAVSVGEPTFTAGAAVYAASASAKVVGSVDPEAVRGAVLGKPLAAAREAAAAFGTVTIVLSPDWTGTVPSDPRRVRIDVSEEDGSSAPTGAPVSTGSP